MEESLLEKHFSSFLTDLSNFEDEAKEQFQAILAKLITHLDTGSSCVPVTADEVELLGQTSLVTFVQEVGVTVHTPLVIYDNHLYLQRYFLYESRLARQLKDMIVDDHPLTVDASLLQQTFAEKLQVGEVNHQQGAAEQALRSPFLIISGGPGTGKTTTAVRVLSLLLHASPERLTVALAAPTGKAAQRLYDSIAKGSSQLPEVLREEVDDWLPEEAVTLHRLLGVRLNSTTFRHNRKNPMGWDVVVVDEASMVDLAMMSKLVDALKPGARLILLGDKDQLASVESGTVLSTVVEGLPGNSVVLQKTYRFNEQIKEAAMAVNGGEGARAFELLKNEDLGNSWRGLVEDRYGTFLSFTQGLRGDDAAQVFALFRKFMVLCATRKGSRGVEGVNRMVEQAIARRGIAHTDTGWYTGRPILITRNDYNLHLYNGDIGICLPDAKGQLRVWFENGREFKGFAPLALSSYQTVYGMTVHKSQGSEFAEVLMLLPLEDSPLLCRELVYTGITRAKETVHLVAEKELFITAVSRYNQRRSCLSTMLLSA